MLDPALLEEVLHQNLDIAGTLAKRRKIDRDNQQPVIQIFAESAGLDHASELPVSGRYDAHIHLSGA